MKDLKVLLQDKFLGTTPITTTVTIKNLKDYGETIAKTYQLEPSKYIVDILLNPNIKLDLSKIKDELVLEPYWTLFTDPYIHIYPRDVEYQDLPPDMKRYLIDFVEPIQALELCKTVPCNWRQLLDHNYDFVTQGFAPGTEEEKFKYLATRVSKNINNTPDIIFVHFDGIPLGKVRFFSLSENHDIDDIDDIIENRREDMEIIHYTLSNSPAVEWVQQDDYNMWIKVIDPKKLPTEMSPKVPENTESRYLKILRGNDMYDYPQIRSQEIDKMGGEYPGIVNITPETIKTMLIKIFSDNDDYDYGDYSDITPETITENQLQGIASYALDWYIFDTTPEYNVYVMMKDNFTRSEAEAYSNAYYAKGDFSSNLALLTK